MRRLLLLFTFLILPALWIMAQTNTGATPQVTSGNANTSAQSAEQGTPRTNVGIPPVVGGSVVYGVNTNGTPTLPRIITPPELHLGSTAPSPVGATNATSGNISGATNSTLNPTEAGEQSGTTPQLPGGFNTSAYSANNNSLSGIASFSSAWSTSTGQEDVAQAARENRMQLARMQKKGARPEIFTNASIAHLRQAAGEPPAGVTAGGGPVTNQSTMPSSDIMPNDNASPTNAGASNGQTPDSGTTPHSPFRSKPSPQPIQQSPR